MFHMKLLFLCYTGFIIAVAARPPLPASTELIGDDYKEAEGDIKIVLGRLAAANGPNYQLGKIIEVRREAAPGHLRFKYRLELEDTKNKNTKKLCNIFIMSRLNAEKLDITIECDGEEKFETKMS